MKFVHEVEERPDGTKDDYGWWQRDGEIVINRNGGWHEYIPERVVEEVEAESFEELDWSCLLQPESDYGWIGLDGKFYGCDYMEHEELASLYFKTTSRRLEEIGYVKVYREYDGKLAYYVSRYLTERQEATLVEKGIEVLKGDR